MNRLQSSVEDGKIEGYKILAVNPFESQLEVRKFLNSNVYSFRFLEAPHLAQKLKIEVTPTTVFIEDGVVISQSSGMSLIGIWKAERFLQTTK